MKQKFVLCMIVICFCVFSLHAQDAKGHFDIEKHKKEQADYFIKELSLTEQEQADFIPLVQEYFYKKFIIHQEGRKTIQEMKKNGSERTSADYDKLLDQVIDGKTKEAELQKEYYQKFRKVLPAQKVLKYDVAEKNFMQREVRRHHGEKGKKVKI